MTELRNAASWYWYVIRYQLRELWDDIPGPWYVKILIIGICFAIPGPQDEILLLMLLRVFRAVRKRREIRKLQATDTAG